jgi:hypothetical protein
MQLAVFEQRRWGTEPNHVVQGNLKKIAASNNDQLATNNVQLATRNTAPLREIILLTRFLCNFRDIRPATSALLTLTFTSTHSPKATVQTCPNE